MHLLKRLVKNRRMVKIDTWMIAAPLQSICTQLHSEQQFLQQLLHSQQQEIKYQLSTHPQQPNFTYLLLENMCYSGTIDNHII